MTGAGEPAIAAGTIRLRLSLPASSLKEKRSLVRPLVERLRARFNASVIEAGSLEDPRTAVIAAVCLSTDRRYVQGQIQAMLNFVQDARTDAVLVDVETEDFVI